MCAWAGQASSDPNRDPLAGFFELLGVCAGQTGTPDYSRQIVDYPKDRPAERGLLGGDRVVVTML